MIADREGAHVRLTAEQRHQQSGHSQLDDVSFVHHVLVGVDRIGESKLAG